MIPPLELAIIQARVRSRRIPEKMLADVGGHPLIWWAWSMATQCFGWQNVVIACPQVDVARFALAVPGAILFGWDGTEDDVLGRLHACAHRNRTDPTAAIFRITPDDLPIDPFREGCTLAELDTWHATITEPVMREHVGPLFRPRLEINTQADLDAARRSLEQRD